MDRFDNFGPCSPKINFRRVTFFGTPCRMYYSSGNFLQQGCELLQLCLCPLQTLPSVHQPVSSTTNRSNRLIINRFLNSGAPSWPVTSHKTLHIKKSTLRRAICAFTVLSEEFFASHLDILLNLHKHFEIIRTNCFICCDDGLILDPRSTFFAP